MKYLKIILAMFPLLLAVGCKERQSASSNKVRSTQDTVSSMQRLVADTSQDITEEISAEYLARLIGSHSITKTVLNHYHLLNDDTDDSAQLLQRMKKLCKNRKMDEQPLLLLDKILQQLNDYERDSDSGISLSKLDSTSYTCESYVNWVFQSFPCFEKDEDGDYYYAADKPE